MLRAFLGCGAAELKGKKSVAGFPLSGYYISLGFEIHPL